MTPRIFELPPHVVGQIAAGEVVERPGSVAKELIENSLDAGATSIEIDVEEGGRDLLRITDNGVGIRKEDLVLAVTSHATSKIRSADDLFQVSTLGFRGEALASIASVSDFRLQSRPPDQETGARIEVQQGVIGPVVDCGCPIGTQIEIRQLFGSVPVRRKFLKSKQTELGHISEALIRVALAHPGVGIKLRHNDRILYERPSDMDFAGAVDLFFGSEVARALIPVDSEGEGVRVHGFVADPSVTRPNNRLQYLFVNGRFIRDRSLGHAIQESYRGLMLTGRFPVAFLFLELPCDQVDVNVHPTKIEVRFEEPRRLYSQILSTIRERFLRADLSARWQPIRTNVATTPMGNATPRAHINEEFALHSSAPSATPNLWSTTTEGPRPRMEESSFEPATRWEAPRPRAPLPPTYPSVERAPTESAWPPPAEPTRTPAADHSDETEPPGLNETVRAIQLHNSYLVVETAEGMLLVDQHALHERILYERLRARVGEQRVEAQELLVPEPVDLTPMQVGLLLEQREVLAELGLRIEEFGDRCLLVQAYPVMLGKVPIDELVRGIACHLEETGKVPGRDQMLEDLLHMVACKAAIKAGDPLTEAEIDALVRQRRLVEDSHHCPHGRPTVLRFTLSDLEKQFQRK